MGHPKLLSLSELDLRQECKQGLEEYLEALNNSGVVVMTTFSVHQGGWRIAPDVGVRLHHVPSGIGVQVCNDRSSFNNMHQAYKLLLRLVNEGQ